MLYIQSLRCCYHIVTELGDDDASDYCCCELLPYKQVLVAVRSFLQAALGHAIDSHYKNHPIGVRSSSGDSKHIRLDLCWNSDG